MSSNLDVQPRPPEPEQSGWQGAIARRFQFDFYQTNLKTEILAGVTTFMTMGYILVVNPLILSNAIFLNESGDLFPQIAFATAISAAIGTFVMALFANYPFGLAPGMGTNAFFAYGVVLGLGIDWRLALSCVFVQGIIFIILTFTDIRRLLILAIPASLKHATAGGIGLFIAYIGLSGDVQAGGAGLIVADEATKTALGSLTQPNTLMAIAGLFITAALIVRQVRGALLIGIFATALLAWILGVSPWPTGLFAVPPLPTDIAGQAIAGLQNLNAGNFLDWFAVLLVFLFVDIFDTIGTLTGVGMRAGYIGADGELPRANRALMSDAVGSTVGPLFGTSSVTAYVESVAGVTEGGRTGFTAVVIGLLFLISLFFIPLFSAIPAFATTPTLVIVGAMMLAEVREIRWGDMAEVIPAFLTVFMIPLTYSIAEGLAIGFIFYPVVKAFQGKAREVPIATWVIAAIFVARFVFMTLRFGQA
ncbi:NCS2 family permease [Microcoleus sp. FACHB-1515]|uniref:NCS2 family permease n=1 Tax=Cyanophyceae TaxID=3028117 RepID=UPI001686DF17|nr:NCS2 family permease [Microcoleus sp. FACHB-1515]MBD2089763.1 NCS2 family permease [Microcoleus sp. FACHB-1515]